MKKSLKYFLILLLISSLVLGYLYYPALNIVTGYSSKNMASGIFLADRDQQSMINDDNGFIPINLARHEINEAEKSVTSTIFGLMKRKAIFKEGLGATLVNEDKNNKNVFNKPNRIQPDLNLIFPYGDLAQKDTLFEEIDYRKLDEAVDNCF